MLNSDSHFDSGHACSEVDAGEAVAESGGVVARRRVAIAQVPVRVLSPALDATIVNHGARRVVAHIKLIHAHVGAEVDGRSSCNLTEGIARCGAIRCTLFDAAEGVVAPAVDLACG